MPNEQEYAKYANNQTGKCWRQAFDRHKNPYEVTAESVQYLNGFIRTQIGRRVSIDFLVVQIQLLKNQDICSVARQTIFL